MNILFITPSVPSRLHRNRAFCLIQALSKNHRIHLLSLSSSSAAIDPSFEELKPCLASYEFVLKPTWKSLLDCLLFLLTPLPLEVAFCRSKKMEALVRELIQLKKIDLIYVKRLRAAQYAEKLDTVGGSKSPIKKMLDSTDAMSLFYHRALSAVPWYKKPLYLEEYFKYKMYEKRLSENFTDWITCSAADNAYLQKELPHTDFHLVPNTVDTSFFKPQPASITEPQTILISGLMDKFVNIEAVEYFMEEIFPLVLAELPAAHVFIVGPNPTKKIKNYAAKNITVTGYVKDIRDVIARSEVVICPIKTGTGTRNKILQAWSLEKPVVTTSRGLEGLDAEHSNHLLVADNPQDFARGIIEVLKSEPLRQKLAKNGGRLVQEKYSLEALPVVLTEVLHT